MLSPEIILDRPFRFDDIEIETTGPAWVVPTEYDQGVDRIWSQKQLATRDGGYSIWDGTYYRVANVAELVGTEKAIALRLGTNPYRYIASSRLLHEQHERCMLPPLRHLSTAAIIRTRDGQYVFGRPTRGGTVDLIEGFGARYLFS